jgi:hypothetical protein
MTRCDRLFDQLLQAVVSSCQSTASRGRHFLFPLVLLSVVLPGCAWTRFNLRPDPTAFGPRTPCKLPANPTAEDLVLVINQNVDRLHSWRAGRVKLRANHMPLTLEADLAVEKGRHLRLVVRHALGGGDELDLGCNDDIFWFWARRQKPSAVMYASHDQLDEVRDNLQIPFEPDWLMEALGVAPIAAEGVTLEPITGTRSTAWLVSHHTLPNGRSIRKAITVDMCHGRVMEHSLWDSATGKRIAHAEFSNHRIDQATGIVMPHHIKLDWPQADLSLAFDLGPVEINPSGLPERIWDMPHPPGYPVMNLTDVARGPHAGAGVQPAGRAPRQQAVLEPGEAEAEDEFWQPRRPNDFDPEEPVDFDAE